LATPKGASEFRLIVDDCPLPAAGGEETPSPEIGFEATIFDCLRGAGAELGASQGATTADLALLEGAEAAGLSPMPGIPEDLRAIEVGVEVGVGGPAA